MMMVGKKSASMNKPTISVLNIIRCNKNLNHHTEIVPEDLERLIVQVKSPGKPAMTSSRWPEKF